LCTLVDFAIQCLTACENLGKNGLHKIHAIIILTKGINVIESDDIKLEIISSFILTISINY